MIDYDLDARTDALEPWCQRWCHERSLYRRESVSQLSLVLVHPVLHRRRALTDLPEVPADRTDQGLPTIAQLFATV